VYADAPPIAWTPPNYTPQPASFTMAMEATYKDLYEVLGSNDIGTVGPTEGYLAAVATRPTSSVSFNYQLQTRAGSADYVDRDEGDWAPTGTLVNGISKTATSITLQAATDLDVIELNSLALLGTGTAAEIVQVTAINLDTLTLTIKRGCVDTTPKTWAAGTRFTSYEIHSSGDEIEYVSGEVVSARFITKTATGALATASAPVATVTMNQRAARPYPPGLVRINGQAWPEAVQNSVTVTWAHRDRLLQVDQVFDQEAGGVGPETGTTYRVRGFNVDANAQIFDQTTDANVYAFNFSYAANLRVELRAVRGGLDSFQLHEHTFAFTPLTLPWTPQDVVGSLSHWFDASDSATVVLTSGAVSQWSDKTQNARHAVQDTAIYRPGYGAGFNGSAASLSFSVDALWAPMPQLASFGIFVAFQRSSGSGLLFDIRNSASTGNMVISDNTGSGFGAYLRNDAGSVSTGGSPGQTTTARFSAWTFDSATGTLQQFLDGVAQNAAVRAGTYTMNRLSIGGNGFTLGSASYTGRVAEVVVTSSIPSTDLRQRIEGYLAWKWGMVTSLPATHPWKNQPPALDYVRTSTANATLAATATRT
jgi:hypothetical protein